jgi:hypothetical protein
VHDTLSFSGVLITARQPQHGIALGSGQLSQDEETATAALRCPASHTNRANSAGQQAVAQIKADQRSPGWGCSFVGMAVVGVLVLLGPFASGCRRRRQAAGRDRLEELRQTAGNTLAQAGSAIQTAEPETARGSMRSGRGPTLPRPIRRRRPVTAASAAAELTGPRTPDTPSPTAGETIRSLSSAL